MPSAVVNTVAYIGFSLTDAAQTAVTGKTNADFTATAYRLSVPATTATPTATEVGSGRYTLAFTPSAAGDWFVAWSVDVDGDEVAYEEQVAVVTAAQADPASALEGAEITVVSPISLTGDISVISGDAASIPWTSSDWDDLTSATVTFQAYKLITDTAVFDAPKSVTKTSVGGASQTVSLALLGTDTDDFTPGIAYRYEVNSTVGTLASGTLSAREG